MADAEAQERQRVEKEKADVAHLVATKFVENYYPVLADTPYMLHNFYHESARFTFTIGSDVRARCVVYAPRPSRRPRLSSSRD